MTEEIQTWGTFALGGGTIFATVVGLGLVTLTAKFLRKVDQGQALVRNGLDGTNVCFTSLFVLPVFHRAEVMDISVKRVEIERMGGDGLICRDNMRADIKVAFFVRVNKTKDDVLKVAQTVGCARASDQSKLQELFDAKFSEALKSVGRQFDFVDLYNSRVKFKDEILKIIGTDLNGYVLDDAAIDYLEQTRIEHLNPNNVLDAEGIKKITDLTARQRVLANQIEREREKTITKQDVEAREAILELQRQLAEAEERQRREINALKAREEAETMRVQQEERRRAEQARILTEEEVQVAEENKCRQIIVAQRNKERTDAVEKERIEKDRQLEAIERERIVALADIERVRAVEVEQKAIQDVIKQRVAVERLVVEERERIKDTETIAQAERERQAAMIRAEKEAQERLVKDIKAAEAMKRAAELQAEQDAYSKVKSAEAERESAELIAQRIVVEAQAQETAAERTSRAKKLEAEGAAAQAAAEGLAGVQVEEARASAMRKLGESEAQVILMKAEAEAQGMHKKAAASKEFNEAGRDHEEFRLKLALQRELELAEIAARERIAEQQALVLSEGLSKARIDLVGGDTQFFEKIAAAVGAGKMIDQAVKHSDVLGLLKNYLLKDGALRSDEGRGSASARADIVG